jgi:hypothetical protein
MRIISKFKDYYDGIGNGIQEGDLLYIRNYFEEVEDVDNHSHLNSLRLRNFGVYGLTTSVEAFLIVHFCGYKYPIFVSVDKKINTVEQNPLHYATEKVVDLEISASLCIELLRNNERYDVKKNRKNFPEDDRSYYGYPALVREFFSHYKEKSDINNRFNSPIVVEDRTGRKIHYHVNCNLASIGFASIIGPNQAWQEIMMWMGTEYSKKENETVEISDKDRIYQHGFDKNSFRKPPTKKV